MKEATKQAIVKKVEAIKKGFADCVEIMDHIVQHGQL
jgi:hypothetical protein